MASQYAERVKKITNDASKAKESAEIQRLKSIIADLKKGKGHQRSALDPTTPLPFASHLPTMSPLSLMQSRKLMQF
jgi:hypothetical protein